MKRRRTTKGRSGRPRTPISARLEEVRHWHGIGSLSEFRRRLVESPTSNGKPYSISDSAVRNYQFGLDPEGTEREPPFSYLNRVCEVFPQVNPGWLLTGEGYRDLVVHEARLRGDSTETGADNTSAVLHAINDQFMQHGVEEFPGNEAVFRAWSTITALRSTPEKVIRGLGSEEPNALARTIVDLVVTPAEKFGIHLDDLGSGYLLADHYADAMCHALVMLVLADQPD